MKGVVFVGFFELVEKEFGYEMVDKLIESCQLESEGIYTSVGTYSHSEMVQLVTKLSEYSKIPVPDLLKVYGKYFGREHLRKYESFYKNCTNTFDFLESIHDHIHVEVKKLYPKAELPHFVSERISETELHLYYTSVRKMSDFAEGLIEDAAMYYSQGVTIGKEMIEEDGSKVKFIINLV